MACVIWEIRDEGVHRTHIAARQGVQKEAGVGVEFLQIAVLIRHHLVPNLAFLQEEFNISRRTLERARAKLSRLGLIERVSWMNTRYGGQEGWKLSGRMSTALRQLADKVDDWRKDQCKARRKKNEVLVRMLN